MKLILTGGFLGSGKTTAIVKACQLLMRDDRKVAVITNDQGEQQVDSAYVRSLGIAGSEVGEGCFCCRYTEFDQQLTEFMAASPDYIFAEAVGSCTDMVATVVSPLQQLHKTLEVVFTVFVDAALLASILENTSAFISESVRYIFRKQMDEADVLVINKRDALTPEQVELIKTVLNTDYGDKVVLFQNSLDESDLRKWLEIVNSFESPLKRDSLDIDYQIYGAGEAELGWADKSFTITSENNSAVFITRWIIGKIFDELQEQRLLIGHLKFYVETDSRSEKVSFTTTSTSAWFQLMLPETNQVRVLINARVQTVPHRVAEIINSVIANAQTRFACEVESGRQAFFVPAYPVPTHRVSGL